VAPVVHWEQAVSIFSPIIKIAKEKGMKYFMVAHERHDSNTPVQYVETDAACIKKLKT